MATTAQSTLVAAFRNLADAEAAASELKATGINPSGIRVSSETGDASASSAEPEHEAGFVGWLKGLFGANDDSERQGYERAYRSGTVLVAADTPEDNIDRVAEILDRHSPIDIQLDSAPSAGTLGSTSGAAKSSSIPVVEEEVKVGKRSVLRGGVRVYSRLREQPVEETVRLQDERVRVERRPVDRPANEADLRAGQEQVIEVDEYAEEPVVSKQARVTEEVRVNKDRRERTETVRDTVRHTQVDVESVGPESSRASDSASDLDEDFRRDFTTRYGAADNYETYLPGYRYGYEMAGDPRYSGRDFNEVESELSADYGRRYPDTTWDKMKAAVRYGWDRMTGRTKASTAR